MTLTVKEVEEMRNALSATFGANVADDLGEKFLNHLAEQSSPYMRATASEWGWDDTEVRDDVCGRAERELGAGMDHWTDAPAAEAEIRSAHTAWLNNHTP